MAAAKQAFNEVLDATPEEVAARHPHARRRLPRRRPEDGLQGHRAALPGRPAGPHRGEDRGGDARAHRLDPDRPRPAEGGRRPRRRRPAPSAIVLITDGEDTCAPLDPCEVAREIAAKGIHLTIDTLGLVPNAKIREQLSCIAEATGGTYTSVRAHRRTLRPGQPVGGPGGRPGGHAGRHRGRRAVRRRARAEVRSVHRPRGVRRAPLVPGGRRARPGAARLGERGGRPRREPGLRGAAAGGDACTAGRSCAARRRATAVRT